MATRSQRYTQLVSSHPYHASISSAPSFALDDGDDLGTVAADSCHRSRDDGLGALTSPRLTTELPRGAVFASDRFFVPPARTASLIDATTGVGEALLVETYSSDPRVEFLESMAEMAAACGAEGMPAPEYREFMEELLSCYLDCNDRAVHRHIRTAFADLTARRRPTTRKGPFRGLMKMNLCVSGT